MDKFTLVTLIRFTFFDLWPSPPHPRVPRQELRGAPARRLLGAFSLGALCTICAALISALLLRSRLIATLGGWATARGAANTKGVL